MSLNEQLTQTEAQIEQLEQEQQQIYADGHVDGDEHPRLGAIGLELQRLWDLRRRLEAAIHAGLTALPVPPPEHPENQVG